MARLILAVLAFALAIAVIKMVIVALVVAGLIFRTKQTIALLFIGGCLTFLAAFPLIGIPLLIVIIIAAIVNATRKEKALEVARASPGGHILLMDDPAQE